jgi:hypothetical protein
MLQKQRQKKLMRMAASVALFRAISFIAQNQSIIRLPSPLPWPKYDSLPLLPRFRNAMQPLPIFLSPRSRLS